LRRQAVVIQVGALDEPPDRLLLGSDAVTHPANAAQARADADAALRELSLSTDRDNVPCAGIDPPGLSTNA
jgi:hypothetical protein